MAAARRPEVERAAVLFLYYRQGYGIRAIARILKRPVATVAGWIKEGPTQIKNEKLRMVTDQAKERSHRTRNHAEGETSPHEDTCPCDSGLSTLHSDCECPEDCENCFCSKLPGWVGHDKTGANIGPTQPQEPERVDMAAPSTHKIYDRKSGYVPTSGSKHLPDSPMGRPRPTGAHVNPFPEANIENDHPRPPKAPKEGDEPTSAIEYQRDHPRQEPALVGPGELATKQTTERNPVPVGEPGRDAINERAIGAMKRYFNLLANDVAHDHALKAARVIDPDFNITPEEAVRAWDSLGMLEQPRKFSERVTGASLMRSHLQSVGGDIFTFGWSPGTIKPPDYVLSVFDEYEWTPKKVDEITKSLFQIAQDNYLIGINNQLMMLGQPVLPHISDPDVLSQLHEEAETAATGVTETYNKELGGKVYQNWVDLRAERGRQMSRMWLREAVDEWAVKRAPWKARQVALTEGAKWFNSAVESFTTKNPQLRADMFDVTPDQCQCDECLEIVKGAPYDLESVRNLHLPVHANCSHYLIPRYSNPAVEGPLWKAEGDAPPFFLTASEVMDLAETTELEQVDPSDILEFKDKGWGGDAQTLRDYWSGNPKTKHGKSSGITWGHPGDYDECVTRVSKFMSSQQAHGYCQLRHMQATGKTAGHAPLEEALKDKHSEGLTNEYDESTIEMWEYSKTQPRRPAAPGEHGGEFAGPSPGKYVHGRPPETKTPGMTPGQKAHVTAHNTASADAEAKLAADNLTAKLNHTDYDGEVGNRNHITRTEEGTMSVGALANLNGARGETPGAHRNRQGGQWEGFVNDVKKNGVQEPIFVTVDRDGEPVISEGNHRRDAAIQAGLDHVPVEVKYFGKAEEQGSVLDRAKNALDKNSPTGQTGGVATPGSATEAGGKFITGSRTGGAGESNFGVQTGRVGDIGEGLFMNGIAPALAKEEVSGTKIGKVTRVTWAEKSTGGHGARNTPLDMMSAGGFGIEVKTLNYQSKNLKTAIKSAEKTRKEQALVTEGLHTGLTVLQVANTDAGVMDVYYTTGFVSRGYGSMTHLGQYKFDPSAFTG